MAIGNDYFNVFDFRFDNSGNFYVAGSTDDTLHYAGITFYPPVLPSPVSFKDYLILVKFDPTGKVLWYKQSTIAFKDSLSPGNGTYMIPAKLAIDNFNNVYVTGQLTGDSIVFSGQLFFDSSNTQASSFNTSCFIVKLDSLGNFLQSTKFAKNGGRIEDIKIDTSGNIFLLGDGPDTIDFYGNKTYSATDYNAFLAKFDCKLNPVFLRTFNDLSTSTHPFGYSYPVSLAITHDGEPIVTIAAHGVSNIVVLGDILIKCDQSGNIIWSKFFDDYTKNIADLGINALGIDPWGNIILGGMLDNGYAVDSLQWGKINQKAIGGWNMPSLILIKLDREGEGIWASQKIIYQNYEAITDLKVTSCGHIIVIGPMLAEFDTSGNVLWEIDDEFDRVVGFSNSPNDFATAWLDISEKAGMIISNMTWAPQEDDSTNNLVLEALTKPFTPCNIKAVYPLSFCEGSYFDIMYNPGANYNYYWQKNGVHFPLNSPILHDSVPGEYNLIATNSITGCTYNFTTVDAVEQKNPSAKISFIHTTKCVTDSIALSAVDLSNDVQKLFWKTPATDSIPTKDTIMAAKEGNYYLEVLSYNGCYAKDSVKIVNSNYSPQISANSPSPLCQGDSVILKSTPDTSLVTYDWLYNQAKLNKTTSSIVADQSGIYIAKLIDSLGCIFESGTISLSFNSVPSISFTTNKKIPICSNDSVQINANSSANDFKWSTGQNSQTINVKYAATYKVIVKDTSGCTNQDSIAITVNPAPFVYLGKDTSFCEGDLRPIVLIATSVYNKYIWDGGMQTSDSSYNVYKAGIHSVQIFNSYGCSASDSILIKDNCIPFFIPNIFTPNGDIKNPTFYIENLIPECTLDIYDRWGGKVYYSGNYANDWDAKGVSDGVYYYYLKNNYYAKEWKGWVQIIR